MGDGQLLASQRNAIRRYDMRPLCCMSFVVNANYLQALSWSLSVGMWCSFVIIHVVMIYKRWQTTRQQLLRGVTSLATLCIYRP
jgi:hypothetical protein